MITFRPKALSFLSPLLLAASLSLADQLHADDRPSDSIRFKTVTYRVGDLRCEGYLAWDSAIEGRRPGVLVVHEWWGLNDYAKRRCSDLAALGYVAFACDMYGSGQTTTHPSEAMTMSSKVRENISVWRDRAITGLSVLAAQDQCDPRELAAIGYCFGGATVLQLAYTGADLDAVVTFHAALPVPSDTEAGRIKGRVLINNGADDTFIKQETIDELSEQLNEANVDWNLVSYPNARHSFTNKDADKAGIDGLAYNAEADRKSWDAMQQLFQEVFRQ